MRSTFHFTRSTLRSRDQRAGFTLIEIIVSLAIFAVVAVVAAGALVRIIAANRQAQTLQSAVNNISFALESISRELRVATVYHCDTSGWTYSGTGLTARPCQIADGDEVLAFESADIAYDSNNKPCNLVHAYRFDPLPDSDNFTLEKAEQSACGNPIADTDFYPVVSPDVALTGFMLGVYDSASNPSRPNAWAFVRLTGYAGARVQDQNYFDVETSVSERVRDPQ